MSLEKDFCLQDPLLMADLATFGGKRNGFMAWDLVAVLHAIRPDRDSCHLSKAGTIQVDAKGVTRLETSLQGSHRYLMPLGSPDRVQEALKSLASHPPSVR